MATRSLNTDRNMGSASGARPSMAPQGSGGAVKARQLVADAPVAKAHLQSQLSQLSSNLSDTENLLRMTAVQAEAMRGLGAWHGGMFMAASRVLGEESVKEQPGNK
ncbi:putative High osmolarity sensitivity protein 3 [Seiridium unicorne]|uniref:High osmolarity sensitivity protein 3 n=1 Tax=Seiridium unicorne TaxID=138068 RepID=A0ABR2UHY5_9PEZI